eukprot:3343210-Amphidinium_carterae.1
MLAPPPLYDHEDAVVKDEVKKDQRRVRFATDLEDTTPHRSGADDQRGIPYSLSDRETSGAIHPEPEVYQPVHKYRTRRQCPNINTL